MYTQVCDRVSQTCANANLGDTQDREVSVCASRGHPRQGGERSRKSVHFLWSICGRLVEGLWNLRVRARLDELTSWFSRTRKSRVKLSTDCRQFWINLRTRAS